MGPAELIKGRKVQLQAMYLIYNVAFSSSKYLKEERGLHVFISVISDL